MIRRSTRVDARPRPPPDHGYRSKRMANWARHSGRYHRRFCDRAACEAKVATRVTI